MTVTQACHVMSCRGKGCVGERNDPLKSQTWQRAFRRGCYSRKQKNMWIHNLAFLWLSEKKGKPTRSPSEAADATTQTAPAAPQAPTGPSAGATPGFTSLSFKPSPVQTPSRAVLRRRLLLTPGDGEAEKRSHLLAM